MNAPISEAFWEITAERRDEYVARGHMPRRFFPHRAHHLPKCGPDGFKLAQRMCGVEDPGAMWEVLLYAAPEIVAAYPEDLFFDDDLVWHRQQFGRPGQIASANVALEGDTVHTSGHVSDVVQRISRRREHNTRVSKHFRGWPHMLLNAVVAFASLRGARRVRVPTAGLAMWNTDERRRDGLGRDLFERIYDRSVADLFEANRDGEWWEIDVAVARDRVLMPERRTHGRTRPKTVCICHDIERGLGHVDTEPEFAARAEGAAADALETMLRIESELNVRATYSVVGELVTTVREPIEAGGHCIAFHSFDHRLDRSDQLDRCRDVDNRVKGYRPPRSLITPELSDAHLLFHNFEWLASSPRSLGVASPELRSALVRIPIALDDYPLHTAELTYEEWEERALSLIDDSDFIAISLHDCYASEWLPRYPGLLEKALRTAAAMTLDEVAAEVTLCSGS
jgi:hypothetical protein